MSAYFLSVNRNKESIALDLASKAGAESVRILARRADVARRKLSSGRAREIRPLRSRTMRRENPQLVTASITGYGTRGSDALAPGFDLLAQAGAGLMAITGSAESGEPTKVGVAVSDLLAGCYAAIGILAALAARERTGRGGHVETDLFSATLASLINVAQSALLTGKEAERHGNAHPQIVPYRVFEASDGEFVLGVGTDRQFERLAALVGRPEWSQSDAFRTNAARVGNRADLEAQLGAIFLADTRGELGRSVPRGRAPGRAGARAARGAALRDGAGARSAWSKRGASASSPRPCGSPARAGGSSFRRPSTPTAKESAASSRFPDSDSRSEISPSGRPRRPEVPTSPCAMRSPPGRWRRPRANRDWVFRRGRERPRSGSRSARAFRSARLPSPGRA